MSKVFFDIAISLDGFMAGEHRGPDNPLGDGGTTLHEWMFPLKAFMEMHGGKKGGKEGPDSDLVQRSIDRTGANIMGKRMFDEGEVHWPEDLFKTDVYVLTHEKREPWVQKGATTFHFINDGIHSALEKAKKSAGGKDIRLNGGGDSIQQYLNAGLVDEFIIHISAIVLGSGIRLFEHIDKNKFDVHIDEVIPSEMTTHIEYKLTKK